LLSLLSVGLGLIVVAIVIVVIVLACILASIFALAYQAIKENDIIALSIQMIAYNTSNANLKYLYESAMLVYQTTADILSDQHVEFMSNSIMLESRANASVITSMVNAKRESIHMKVSIERIVVITEVEEEKEKE
jgi:hypothetical protein